MMGSAQKTTFTGALPCPGCLPDTSRFERYLERYFDDINAFTSAYLDQARHITSSPELTKQLADLRSLVADLEICFGKEIVLGRVIKQWSPNILSRLDRCVEEIEQITGRSIGRQTQSARLPQVPVWNDALALEKATDNLLNLAYQTRSFTQVPQVWALVHQVRSNVVEPDPELTTALVDEFGAYAGRLQEQYALDHGAAPRWREALSPNLKKALFKNLEIKVVGVASSGLTANDINNPARTKRGIKLNIDGMALLWEQDQTDSNIASEPFVLSALASLNALKSTAFGLEQLYLLSSLGAEQSEIGRPFGLDAIRVGITPQGVTLGARHIALPGRIGTDRESSLEPDRISALLTDVAYDLSAEGLHAMLISALAEPCARQSDHICLRVTDNVVVAMTDDQVRRRAPRLVKPAQVEPKPGEPPARASELAFEQLLGSSVNLPRLCPSRTDRLAVSDAMVNLLLAIYDCHLTPMQQMILWAVDTGHRSGRPYDKTSLAVRIKQPRQTVARHVNGLIRQGLLHVDRSGHQDFLFLGNYEIGGQSCDVSTALLHVANLLRSKSGSLVD